MPASQIETPRINILALPESTASVMYGFYDVLTSAQQTWCALIGKGPETGAGFDVRIVSVTKEMFRCSGNIPVAPVATLDDVMPGEIVLVSDLTIDNRSDPRGRWSAIAEWLTHHYRSGGMICTVCTGSVLLADTGLLDGREATTHWAYAGLIEEFYPNVKVRPERMLLAADPECRLITTGGMASWEDLSLYLIDRFCSRTEAVRTAKIFLFGDRGNGQLPYAAMVHPRRHGDNAIADCQEWIADNYSLSGPVARMAVKSGLPDRTFKRRFKAATGFSPVEYVQTLRIEESKQLLERTMMHVEEVGAAVGYEDTAFFRRLFKRQVGITPARYRLQFQSVGAIGDVL